MAETVCVTGANGFIGSWLVRALLEKGYTVRGTCQPRTPTSHLLSLPAAHLRLSLFDADLLDSAAIHAAVAGCSGVFHVASPCTLEDPRDPQQELIRPAVEGTLNVLEASRSAGARRVVVTSSISALVPNPGWPHCEKPVDESSWTDLDYCRARQVRFLGLRLGFFFSFFFFNPLWAHMLLMIGPLTRISWPCPEDGGL